MNTRELTACLAILMFALLATVHIQLFAVFYVSNDTNDGDDSDMAECYRKIQVTFTKNTTAEDLLAEWRSFPADGRRLLAIPRKGINYVAVGCVLPSDTLSPSLSVLAQLVNFTSFYHKLHSVVVVVILNDVDRRSADQFVETITSQYLYELSIGFIQVLQQAARSDDGSESSMVAGRQIEAMSLISEYVATIASHYLHLGSADVVIPSDYMYAVTDFESRETRRRRRLTSWTLLPFGTNSNAIVGTEFIGHFFHATDLYRFASFFVAFAAANVGRPNCTATLQRIFLDIVTQRVALCRRPPLFRCRGEVVDGILDVKKPWPAADDPPATILSSMQPVGSQTVDLAYSSGAGYFHCVSVTPGDWIALVFDAEVSIERILVETGLPDGSLTLSSGFVELSPRLLRLDPAAPSVVCADFVRVGEIVGKSTELVNVAKLIWGRPTRCLRLTVGELTEAANEVVFHQIAVFSGSK